MKQKTLTEEKGELILKLLVIISKLEKITIHRLNIVDIVPISKGLKVAYTVTTDKVRQWSKIIKYSDLANED